MKKIGWISYWENVFVIVDKRMSIEKNEIVWLIYGLSWPNIYATVSVKVQYKCEERQKSFYFIIYYCIFLKN